MFFFVWFGFANRFTHIDDITRNVLYVNMEIVAIPKRHNRKKRVLFLYVYQICWPTMNKYVYVAEWLHRMAHLSEQISHNFRWNL